MSVVTKILDIVFKNATGEKAVVSVHEPKEELTKAMVQVVADAIVKADIFPTKGGPLVEFDSARIRVAESKPLE